MCRRVRTTKSLASIGERIPTEFGVPSASGEQGEVALSFYEEAAEGKRWRDSMAAGGS